LPDCAKWIIVARALPGRLEADLRGDRIALARREVPVAHATGYSFPRTLYQSPLEEALMFEITLSGPGKNALGTEMMDFLLEKLREADGRPVLLTGGGDAFSAGLNLKEVASLEADGMERFLRKLETVCSALYRYPGPTVALVNGHAIAGGCILALCCDYRVAAADPKIKIGLNEVALGLRFPPFIFSLVRSRISHEHQDIILLGAGLHPPLEALRLGMIDEVAEDAGEVARRRLAALGAHPARAYAMVKADLRGSEVGVPAAKERQFIEEVLPTWTSPELKQRLMAALKR
jgi:enoyl-CoA hydratase/carnithine racemase